MGALLAGNSQRKASVLATSLAAAATTAATTAAAATAAASAGKYPGITTTTPLTELYGTSAAGGAVASASARAAQSDPERRGRNGRTKASVSRRQR